MSEFEIVDRPGRYRGRGKWDEIKQALAALPEGKALRLPSDTFNGHQVTSHIKSVGDLKVRYRTLPEGVCIWLEGKRD